MKTRIGWLLMLATILMAAVFLVGCGDQVQDTKASATPTPKVATGVEAARMDGLLDPILTIPYGASPTAKYFIFGGVTANSHGSVGESSVCFLFRDRHGRRQTIELLEDRCILELNDSVTTPTVRLNYREGLEEVFYVFRITPKLPPSRFIDAWSVRSATVRMSHADFDRGVWSPDGPWAPAHDAKP